MEELLPYFQRELGFLAEQGKEFAARYPGVAKRLAASGNPFEDPHAERMMQAFALLTARIHKRLDDDFPLVTDALLEVLYPHYLRPFPSCSIAAFDLGADASQLTKVLPIARGRKLDTREVRGTVCKMRTAYDVALLPLRVASARWQGTFRPPPGSQLPAAAEAATTLLSIRLDLVSPQARWDKLGVDFLRLYLDGEPSLVSALRDALLGHVVACLVQLDPAGPWLDGGSLPRAVGFAADEALIDADARTHPAYRLLTELFAFPAKFNFVDLPLPAALRGSDARAATIHFAMAGLRPDSDAARLLDGVSSAQFVTGATPVVNLFQRFAAPVHVSQQQTSYAVVVDARRAAACEVVSIDEVRREQRTAEGELGAEIHPFHALSHDELLAGPGAGGRYWFSQRDPVVAQLSPGYETEILIVDAAFNPAHPQTDTLSIKVTATNRNLPSELVIGQPKGDLFLVDGGMACEIRLLRLPTRTQRFERGRGALWRLVSHLSLNHLSLSGGGIVALKEMLRLYDLPQSEANQRLVRSLVAIETQAVTAWLEPDPRQRDGSPFASMVRGMQVRLTVEEAGFVGVGLRLFAQTMDHFMGLYVHANTFSQLVVVAETSGKVLYTGPRRSGESPLL